MKQYGQRNLERKWFIHLTLLHQSLSLKAMRARTQARQRPNAEAIEDCCLLTCFPWFAQGYVLKEQDLVARGGPTHNGLNTPTSITNWENALEPPTDLYTARS